MENAGLLLFGRLREIYQKIDWKNGHKCGIVWKNPALLKGQPCQKGEKGEKKERIGMQAFSLEDWWKI